MKTMYHKIYLLLVLCTLVSCDKFLDKVPDQRTEIDSNQKISELLVSAYPNVDPMMIYEHRTDNVMDNGRRFGEPTRMITENYNWEDISETDWDAPEALWNSCYRAVAAANQALQAIEALGESPENAPIKEKLSFAGHTHIFCWPIHSVNPMTKLRQLPTWGFLT